MKTTEQRTIRARLQVRMAQLQAELQAETARLTNVPVETAILQHKQQTTAALLLGAPF